jgi:hypothetical protein
MTEEGGVSMEAGVWAWPLLICPYDKTVLDRDVVDRVYCPKCGARWNIEISNVVPLKSYQRDAETGEWR